MTPVNPFQSRIWMWLGTGAVTWNKKSLLGDGTNLFKAHLSKTTMICFTYSLKHCCHTSDLSSALADEIFHPCLQGSVQLLPSSSASHWLPPIITSATFQPGPTGQKELPALVHEMSTENPQYPKAVRLLISLISYSICCCTALIPLNQMGSQASRACLVLPRVLVHSFPR